jgi:hypothetical protein
MVRTLRALLCASLAAVILAPTANSTTSPNILFASMLIAGEQQRSVHFSSIQSAGADRVLMTVDAGVTQGIQRITCTCNGQLGHVTVLVTGGNAYVLGDTFGLTNYMHYKSDAVANYSERWIQIPPTDPNFKAVSADVTLASSIGDLYAPTPRWLSAGGGKGSSLIGVSGTKPATANSPAITVSLYTRATGKPLPVEEDIVKGTYQAKLTFEHWNERVQIATPANATPISTTGLE